MFRACYFCFLLWLLLYCECVYVRVCVFECVYVSEYWTQKISMNGFFWGKLSVYLDCSIFLVFRRGQRWGVFSIKTAPIWVPPSQFVNQRYITTRKTLKTLCLSMAPPPPLYTPAYLWVCVWVCVCVCVWERVCVWNILVKKLYSWKSSLWRI